nr:PspC domain-containing protein [Nakamurella endophytica]
MTPPTDRDGPPGAAAGTAEAAGPLPAEGARPAGGTVRTDGTVREQVGHRGAEHRAGAPDGAGIPDGTTQQDATSVRDGAVPPAATPVPPGVAPVPPGDGAVPPAGAAVPSGGVTVPPAGAAVPPGGAAVPPAGAAGSAGPAGGPHGRRVASVADGLTPDGIPRLYRRRDHAVVGGVAGGLAVHLRVPVLWVRVTFALLSVMAGAGILAYALLWIFVRPDPRTAEEPLPPLPVPERRQALGVAALGAALMIAAAALGFGQLLGWVLGPLGLAAVGAAFVWREADEARRARWRRTAAGIVGPARGSWWRLGGGCALVVGGLSVFALGQLDFTAVRSALVAVLLTLVGVAVITVPWWVRLVRDLGAERSARVAAAERAEIAAHLHDSVLQTLALIQKQAGDNREVLRLARSQERELRTWLFGPAGYATAPGGAPDAGTTLAAAVAAAAGEVEDTYAVAVAPVVVGDAAMDPHLAALVAAAREAMVNAAKHAGVDEISVYAEVEDGTATVYVRDRGVGFDPDAVDGDRRGLAHSIRGRMARHGGTAVVRSRPGEGTEVQVSVPVQATAGDPDPAHLGAAPAATPPDPAPAPDTPYAADAADAADAAARTP